MPSEILKVALQILGENFIKILTNAFNPFPNVKISDSSKLKEFTDINF